MVKKLNYATLSPGGSIIYKHLFGDSYNIFKKEIDGNLGVIQLGQLYIWYDDGFLFNENPHPTLVIKRDPSPQITDWDTVLCGTVLFASHGTKGNKIGLTQEARMILARFQKALMGNKEVFVYVNYSEAAV
ncbi:hypothetical protein [Metabacillus arenae]|uniref:Uncharacterized protein n=1 Tax=Metabacillus arenae TaxID=2771434 RepID=A0A926NDS0_9BACI|nr:hypothetical protein [Metabacillus arenae]MBD1379376.1 hypothetical protein [Metabacillus arenae]